MYLKAAGMKQKLTVHDTLQHNGVAECLNHTLLEKVRAMLHESGLPCALWGEAVRHAVWLKNQTPTKALEGRTPLEAATGQKPDLSRARVWGSHVWVHVEGGTKLGGHVVEGCWVGIDDNSPNGCRVYWPEKHSVSVEQNMYWDPTSAEPLSHEGEQEESNLPNVILTAPPPVPVTRAAPPAPVILIPPKVAPPPDDLPVEKRVRKPSQRVADILAGQGNIGRRGQPTVPRGVQLPTEIAEAVILPELTDPLNVDNLAAAYLMTVVEDSDDVLCAINFAMMMEGATTESEALEPSSLAEAR